jgi:hypothetical protein
LYAIGRILFAIGTLRDNVIANRLPGLFLFTKTLVGDVAICSLENGNPIDNVIANRLPGLFLFTKTLVGDVAICSLENGNPINNVIANRLRNHSRLPKHLKAMWQSAH